MSVQPLLGRRIVITRAREQSSALCSGLRALGAEAIEVPTIRIVPPASYTALDDALRHLHCYDMLLVTSANTARVLAGRSPGIPAAQPWTAVVGPATAEALLSHGWRVDARPESAVAESLLQLLSATARGKRILLPQAESARDVLARGLEAAGAQVEVVTAYRTEPAWDSIATLAALFASDAHPVRLPVDAVTFTSSSTVTNFVAIGARAGLSNLREMFEITPACSIGPVTSQTLRANGIEPAVEAHPHDVEGLIRAVRMLLSA